MHWLKRSAATCLAVLLLLTSLPMALAAPSDQPLTRGETASILLDAAKDYNKNVTYQDILKGYPNGDLDESGSVTRAQALVMLQRAFGEGGQCPQRLPRRQLYGRAQLGQG